ncbi:FAD-dependent oxidoreductase [Planotetraspora sp. A-T 1434]|uniref:NAD(P)/FAD-dependent oxidoreductase n=1 Tax=Planotetraspora sp. A-T 1434 TaxID=2979219 RepID=UPI0021C0A9F5|nr:FAD-dependent oxidoreductase [Planotetraspora sp. A-T 1434]MCT9932245.1 FAD-dependent oxidoreductase [Planotetraspora sp. A-T 1434]
MPIGPVLVVGGGVVGLSLAHYLTAAGIEVEVVERSGLASGASWGNAGWVCLSHSTPVPGPGVVRYGLRSLGRPDSPLYLRPSADPRFLAWLWRFWRSSGESTFRRGYAALADLNRPTFDLFEELADAGVDTTLRRPGLVHAFLSADEARHHLRIQQVMASGRYDMPEDVVEGDEAHRLDPALSPEVRAAYLVRGEGVLDPRRLVESLGEVVRDAGGKVHEHVEVTGFRTVGGRVAGARTSAGDIDCGSVVIAAGMWSSRLLRHFGLRLPLQAGKGYSFTVELETAPEHSLYFGDRRIVASPIGGTTRLAGTMELSGDDRRLNWQRIVAIARGSRRYLGRWFEDQDDLPTLIRDPWVGGRPLLPDGLPVIDRLPGRDDVFLATGHGMLGVTLGPATGRALADYVLSGRRPPVLAPFGFR